MTPKSLFNIILKVIGLYLLLEFITQLFIFFAAGYGSYQDISLVLLLGMLLYILVVYVLIFKSSLIVKILKLAEGFESDKLDINVSLKVVLRISVIVCGATLLLNSIPGFFNSGFAYISTYRYLQILPANSNSGMITNGSKILIGLLLLGYQRQIATIIESKSKE
ncbi:MAG: hypothetical protein H0X33_08810 [Taibaiella sp.]|nr:hypothetical protein [Taibaiella sp.]